MRRPLLALLLAALPWLAVAAPEDGEAPLPGLGGPIDLVDQAGHAFHLSQMGRRKALVFFGFTHCGTMCPTAMLTARQVLASAQAGDAPPVVLFVTIDPLNDTPAHLRDYLRMFDPRVVGLTGAPDQVWRVAQHYGVGIARDGQSLAHSSRWYVVDADGRIDRVYTYDTPPDRLAAALHLPLSVAQEASR
jgi:protein SCO1/2